MVILRCKMCGGSLEYTQGCTVAQCEYCGSLQTVPSLTDEKKAALFDRAGSYRSNSEFDKASAIYESIVTEYPDDAEAHWGLCLCRYGIEYVKDPRSNKRTPTCHRTQFKSILQDSDYLEALKNADPRARELYISEATYIDGVQKAILQLSSKESPYDIFICYKESADDGNRTVDSVIAQEIYYALTEKGYKVFFSRITLEDKLGSAYEPYIFAALNSSAIMLAVGTKPEYFNAVWVKNEWGRFVALIEQGHKKTLIPCYRDMSASDMPAEFAALQGQDVSKIGWLQDLIRGIGKILPCEGEKKQEKTAPPNNDPFNKDGMVEASIGCVQSRGSKSTQQPFPTTPVTSVVNRSFFPCISLQALLNAPIKVHGNVLLGLKIYDPMGNMVFFEEEVIKVAPGNDRLAKIWILAGGDGSYVADGKYRAVMSLNRVGGVDYYFEVISDRVEPANRNFQAQNVNSYQNVPNDQPLHVQWAQPKKSLAVYLLLCFFFGMFGVHNFYAGKNKKAKTELICTCTLVGIYVALPMVIYDFFKALTSGKVPPPDPR